MRLQQRRKGASERGNRAAKVPLNLTLAFHEPLSDLGERFGTSSAVAGQTREGLASGQFPPLFVLANCCFPLSRPQRQANDQLARPTSAVASLLPPPRAANSRLFSSFYLCPSADGPPRALEQVIITLETAAAKCKCSNPHHGQPHAPKLEAAAADARPPRVKSEQVRRRRARKKTNWEIIISLSRGRLSIMPL